MITILKIISIFSFLSAILQKRIINSIMSILLGLISFVTIFIEHNMKLIGIFILIGYVSFTLVLLAFNNATIIREKSQKIDYINAIFYLAICTIFCLILFKNHINMKLNISDIPDILLSKEIFNLPFFYFFSIGLMLFLGIISSSCSKIKFKVYKKIQKNTVKLIDISREKK